MIYCLKNLFWLALLLTISCKQANKKEVGHNPIGKYLLSNDKVSSSLKGKLSIDEKSTKCFKVVISRRNTFLRVTIFQLINREELGELPSSYFKFYNNTFVCYDGSEVLENKHVSDYMVNALKSKMKTGVINDSPVFQLDILNNGKVLKVNDPVINPYDFDEKLHSDTVSFRVQK